MNIKKQLILLAGLVLVALFVYAGVKYLTETPPPVATEPVVVSPMRVIGKSVEGRNIEAYTYGDGNTHMLFVGGIHGGYEWNSVMLAYEIIDYLEANPEQVPADMQVSIIPTLNPDGLYAVVGKSGRFTRADVPSAEETVVGRFNANDVDLNRNFDCKWKPESSWRGAVVSAGADAFSEPEAVALHNFVQAHSPDAVVFWHSQAGNVYASECEAGVLPETVTLMNTYADAAGYGAVETFDAYEVTGDAEGWLASINIPAITVEFDTHESSEFEKNLRGFKAVLGHYAR